MNRPSQSLGKICGGQGGMSVQFFSAQQFLYALAILSLHTLSNSNSLARIEVIQILQLWDGASISFLHICFIKRMMSR